MNFAPRNLILACALLASTAGLAQAQSYAYKGHADAILIKTADGQILSLGSAGPLPKYRDSQQTVRLLDVNLLGVFADVVYAHTEGIDGRVFSEAKVTGVKIKSNVPGTPPILVADVVESRAVDKLDFRARGDSTLLNLRINGKPYSPSGFPNEKIKQYVPGVGLIVIVLNEKRMLPDGKTIEVNAARVDVLGIDIILCQSVAGVLPITTVP